MKLLTYQHAKGLLGLFLKKADLKVKLTVVSLATCLKDLNIKLLA